VDANFEEEGGVRGKAVNENVDEAGGDPGHRVHQQIKVDHLNLSPERLEEFPIQVDDDDANDGVPPVSLHEGMRGEGPYPVVRREEKARSDTEGIDGGVGERQQVADDHDAGENAHEQRGGGDGRAHLRAHVRHVPPDHLEENASPETAGFLLDGSDPSPDDLIIFFLI